VQTLGGFHVLRRGEPVPFAEWRSKKARDLVKILVTRNGAPTTRERLIDELWPDTDSAAGSNRLSVALSTARTVLDPEREFAQDHFIGGDHETVRLRPEHVSIDVQVFLHDAAEGLALRRDGRLAEAAELLRAAEEAYAGDYLEENSYDDWAVPLRDQATATYIDVLRALAADSADSGDRETAVRFYLRLLERDPYDEPTHLQLVRTLEEAGRHGEARRRYRGYCGCMREIDVEAAPFPAV
jgi:DNA-binding SARP family transcriptional activator